MSTVEKIKTEVEPVVKVKTEGKSATVNKAPESKSVFSRLGATDQASSSSRLWEKLALTNITKYFQGEGGNR